MCSKKPRQKNILKLLKNYIKTERQDIVYKFIQFNKLAADCFLNIAVSRYFIFC